MNKFKILFVCAAILNIILAGCSPRLDSTANEAPQTATPNLPAVIPPEAVNERIPVIYSHGGGPCDIGGMVFLTKHPDVDLIGLVLTRGEFHPEIAVNKWPVFLFDVLNSKDTAIGLGTDLRMDPVSHEFPESWRPLSDNFWGLELPEQVTDFDTTPGHKLIIDLVTDSPAKVTIVAMASLIDVALALQEDPSIIDNISHIVIMGGAFTVPGNLSDSPDPIDNQVAEWNIWIDAAAAKYVFNSGVPMSIVPLDAIQYLVNPQNIETMNSIVDPAANYVAQMWDQQHSWGGDFLIWDTITATAVTNPENFYWTYDGVDVITEPATLQGQTIALDNGASHTRYATGADYQAILDLLFSIYRDEPSTSVKPPDKEQTGEILTGISALAGIWTGYTGGFHITFNLGDNCQLNEKCGTFEISEFSLTGDVTIVSADGNLYEFKASNLSSGVESAAVYETLQILENGTVKYFSAGPDGGSSEAILINEEN